MVLQNEKEVNQVCEFLFVANLLKRSLRFPFSFLNRNSLVAFELGVAMIVIGAIVKLTVTPLKTKELPEAPTPAPVVKETIMKEVVLIPRKYCGALMPQTSTFCPNSGARREA